MDDAGPRAAARGDRHRPRARHLQLAARVVPDRRLRTAGPADGAPRPRRPSRCDDRRAGAVLPRPAAVGRFARTTCPTTRPSRTRSSRPVPISCSAPSIAWLAYLGIEPWIRRHWPASLISWSRLLAGSFRDPLVGRDVLLGAAFGVGGAIYPGLIEYGCYALGGDALDPSFTGVWSLTTPRYVGATLLSAVDQRACSTRSCSRCSTWSSDGCCSASVAGRERHHRGAGAGDSGRGRHRLGHDGRGHHAFDRRSIICCRWRATACCRSWPPSASGRCCSPTRSPRDLGAWYATPTWIVGGALIGLAIYAFVQSRAGAPTFGRLLED